MQLRRVAELSGMSVHCDFTEQQSVDTEKGKIRPDMIVHLPMDREIVVDSKVSLEAYLDTVNASTDDEKRVKDGKTCPAGEGAYDQTRFKGILEPVQAVT